MGSEVDDRHRAFAGDAARIHARERAPAGRANHAFRVRPTSAPVAYIDFAVGKHDVKGLNSHLPQPQHLPGGGIQLREAIGKVERDVKPLAVRGNGDAGGDFRRAPRRIGRRQGERTERRDYPVFSNSENFDVPIDVRQVNARAIG